MTRDDKILLGAGALGLLAIGAIYYGKSSAMLNAQVAPIYSGSFDEGPGYMSVNAPKSYIPIDDTQPCGCGSGGQNVFGSVTQAARQLLANSSGILANMASVGA